VDFNIPSNCWVSQLKKSEIAVLVLGFEKLGLELDNCGRTTKNAYCHIYSPWLELTRKKALKSPQRLYKLMMFKKPQGTFFSIVVKFWSSFPRNVQADGVQTLIFVFCVTSTDEHTSTFFQSCGDLTLKKIFLLDQTHTNQSISTGRKIDFLEKSWIKTYLVRGLGQTVEWQILVEGLLVRGRVTHFVVLIIRIPRAHRRRRSCWRSRCRLSAQSWI
jgi:hypothetical protein